MGSAALIDEHRRGKLAGQAVGKGRKQHAAIAVGDGNDILEHLPFDDGGEVADMGVEAGIAGQQMFALAKSGERRGEHVVAAGDQPVAEGLPHPATGPGAVDKKDVGHLS